MFFVVSGWWFLLLACGHAAFCQVMTARVSMDEAMKHLVSSPSPTYPGLARQTHVSGNVLLEIAISPEGRVSVRRIISGHPLLLPPAVEAVVTWKFQEFLMEGKPVTAITDVIIPFGDSKAQKATDQVEVRVQYDFWSHENLFRSAFQKGDIQSAEEHLAKAQEVLASTRDKRNSDEDMQWWFDKGDLSKSQQKNDLAEQSYMKALEAIQKLDNDSPQHAMILGILGGLHQQQKRYDEARNELKHSLAIYEKALKETSPSSATVRQNYSTAIARESWLLAGVEWELNHRSEAEKRCRTSREFQAFLPSNEKDAASETCKKVAGGTR
jgi:hypothetical protein